MKLKSIGPRLVVQFKKPEPKKGQLILPNEEQPQFATIVEIGKDNAGHEYGLRIGDLVALNRHSGQQFKVGDEMMVIVELKDVIAKVENENET